MDAYLSAEGCLESGGRFAHAVAFIAALPHSASVSDTGAAVERRIDPAACPASCRIARWLSGAYFNQGNYAVMIHDGNGRDLVWALSQIWSPDAELIANGTIGLVNAANGIPAFWLHYSKGYQTR